MKVHKLPEKCKKHENYKRKPTWTCEKCAKEKDFWEKLKK